MKTFIPEEFITLVKNYKEATKHITCDAQAKCQICQVAIDHGYDCADVLDYIYRLWVETYPDFTGGLNSKKWNSIFKNYIKEALAEYDWEIAKELKEALESVHSKGKEREEELRTKFFSIIEGMGLAPDLMEKDMSIDLWGWIKTVDLIISQTYKDSDFESDIMPVSEVVSVEPIESVAEPAIVESCEDMVSSTELTVIPDEESSDSVSSADMVTEKKKKTRKRVKYVEILQYTLEGELIGRFKNIVEAAKSGDYRHPSISKCISGKYDTYKGFKWVGVKQSTQETNEAA